MTRLRRVPGCGVALLTLVHFLAASSAAQDTTRARVDTVRQAAEQEDSSAARPRFAPIPEPEVPVGPLAPGSRYVFTRDSLLWSGAMTLADLLAHIPGVYVARMGFAGEPEYIQYGGRGGSALELYWDGVPWAPVGGDSLFADAGRIPLTYLRRVDVEALPALLRVYIVSERHEGLQPRTKVRVESGVFKTAQYTVLFQKRTSGGVGLDLAGHFFGTDGPRQAAGSDAFDIWAKLGWNPTARIGASYQVRQQSLNRKALSGSGGPAAPARKGSRTDVQIGLRAATRTDGLGVSGEAGLALTTWSPDSGAGPPDQTYRRAHVGIRVRQPNWTLEVRGQAADARTPVALVARAGWAPLGFVVLAGDAGWQKHSGDRFSRWLVGTAAVHAGPFYLAGTTSVRNAVQAPAVRADTALPATDLSIRAGLDTRLLTGHVALVQRDSFAPLPFPELLAIPGFPIAPRTTYLQTEVYLRPNSAVTLSGWYSSPLSGDPVALQPPAHFRAAGTFRSKFWRRFRSGAFDLKAQVALESWGAGTAGLRSDGSSIALPAATFWEFHLEIQLVGFTAFWSLRNARLSDAAFVPGLPYPGNAQLFGGSWEFGN